MPALIIGETERHKITELRAFAAANVMDPERAVTLTGAELEAYRDMMTMMSIQLPVGFNVTYSHERQPFGLCQHISISVDRPNKMPSPEAYDPRGVRHAAVQELRAALDRGCRTRYPGGQLPTAGGCARPVTKVTFLRARVALGQGMMPPASR